MDGKWKSKESEVNVERMSKLRWEYELLSVEPVLIIIEKKRQRTR